MKSSYPNPPSPLTGDFSPHPLQLQRAWMFPLILISVKNPQSLAVTSLMPTHTHTCPNYSDNKARTGSQKQQKHQHLQDPASHHTSPKRGRTLLFNLPSSTPRRRDDCLCNPKDAQICLLVAIIANDAGSIALSEYQRTIQTLLEGASEMF